MSKVLERRLRRTLAATRPAPLAEAGEPFDMFGRPKEGKTFEDLKWVVGPCTDNPRRVAIVDGRRVDAGPAERWTIDEVWAAIAPVVRKIARKYASGGWARNKIYDPDAFEDLVQNAALKVLQVITRGDDEARIGNQFVTWLRGHIQSAIRGGVTGGVEYDRARGFLGLLERAKDVTDVDAQIERIQLQDRQYHGHLYRRDNEFGKFAPRLYQLAQRLRVAFDRGDPEEVRRVKREIHREWEEIGDAEGQEVFAGAATGLHDTFNRPHSGVGHEKARELKRQPTEVKGEGGEMIDNPRLPSVMDDTEESANREIVRHFLEVVRYGYRGPEGEVPPLDQRKYRILIRYVGIPDYPDRGTERDPELLPERYQEAVRQMETHGTITVRPVNVTEAARFAEIAGADRETYDEIISATIARDRGEYGNPMESDAADIEIDVDPRDKDTIREIASILGYSYWVRQGCPHMTNKELADWLGVSTVRVTQFLRELGFINRPGQPGLLRRLGTMLGPRLTGEVPEDEVGPTKEGHDRVGDILTEAIVALWEASDIYRRRALLTEACDDVGCRLVLQACRYVTRRTAEYLDWISRADA